jgi:hypothetical protein
MAGAVDTFLKISVAVSLLGAAGSVAYYHSIYLPMRDAQLDRDRKQETSRAEYARQSELAKATAQKREAEIRDAAEKREAAERQAAERETIQSRYQGCVRRAEYNYNSNWAQQCKKEIDGAATKYKDCISQPQADKNFCNTLYSARNNSPTDCSLHRVLGGDLNDQLEKSRKRCLDESRAGLQ